MVIIFKFYIIVLLCASLIHTIICFDYCTIKTCEGEHTMCKCPNDTIACAADGVKAGLTEELRKAILDRHNVHRQTVALGKQTPQPPASNMMKLTWHEEAEKIAQRWANQCISDHDTCRNIENSTVGQNMALQSLNLTRTDVKGTILEMIDKWFAEVDDFDQGGVGSYKSSSGGKTVGHYTQMVWAKTLGVGCGFIQMAPKNQNYPVTHLICNYVPAGNVISQSIYKEGEACSACDQCSNNYPGLCLQ